jgi:Kdo2-lipid IVA lauroyltransferase/acyltransferase
VKWSRTQRIKNDAIYGVVFVALLVARALPGSWLRVAGRALGRIAWWIAPRTRALAIANAPDAGVARAAYRSLGELLGDTLLLLRPSERAGLSFVPGARGVLEHARAAGRGVVLITAHLGPWERLAAALVAEGFPLTTPVRPSYDPRLEALLHAPLRACRGVHAIDRDAPSTARVLLRALRANEVAGFLVDLNTRVASIEVPFFGKPAWTPSGPARLALRTGAPVVAAFATRAGITVRLLREASPPCRADDGAVFDLTSAMTSAVEDAIRSEPDRWIWMHDRWGAQRTKTNEPVVRTGSVDQAVA